MNLSKTKSQEIQISIILCQSLVYRNTFSKNMKDFIKKVYKRVHNIIFTQFSITFYIGQLNFIR